MSDIVIRCPHCGYSKKTQQDKIPPNTQNVKCPRCEESFALAAAIQQLPGAAPEPVGQTAATEPEPSLSQEAAGDESAPPISPQPPAVSRERVAPRQVSFDFQGTGKEYFGIWIVNTLLKIVTLGIYSPWAKVRKRSYFYGCTRFEGMNFDYLADPIALLKGWILGAVLFLLYSFGAKFSPIISMIVGLLIFVLMPWVIVRSRLFNSRNSAHRNIRFNFYPDYKGAYFAYFWLSLLTPLTGGILMPYVIYRQKQFLVENSSYGKTAFTFNATGKDYYLLCLRGLGIIVLLFVIWGAAIGLLGPMMEGFGARAGAAPPLFAFFMPLMFFFGYLFIALYFYVRISNLTWNRTRLGRHRFHSNLKVLEMLWIFFSNGVAIFASLGLLTPWATVRLTRYRLEKLVVTVDGSLEEFEAANKSEVSAAGEEIGDIFGLDIGF